MFDNIISTTLHEARLPIKNFSRKSKCWCQINRKSVSSIASDSRRHRFSRHDILDHEPQPGKAPHTHTHDATRDTGARRLLGGQFNLLALMREPWKRVFYFVSSKAPSRRATYRTSDAEYRTENFLYSQKKHLVFACKYGHYRTFHNSSGLYVYKLKHA